MVRLLKQLRFMQSANGTYKENNLMSITVANKRSSIGGEYIGRPSPLGNPFVIGRDGTRDEVIAKYRSWLLAQLDENKPSAVLTEMDRLVNLYENNETLTLVCWCAPKACHGDVLAQAIPWWSNKEQTNG